MRVLIAVTHLLGAGHLTRAAALARAFAGAGHDVVLASGGAPAPLVRVDGARLVQLPPLRVRGTAFSDLRDAAGDPADAALLARRRAMLLAALDETAPEILITELFPFGRRALAGEFLALVEAARARRPLVLASIRDILVAPEKPGRVAEAHARVAALYDGVLVHADPGLAPLDASWPVDGDLTARLHYTGYVDEGGVVPAVSERAGILVSAGSSAAGLGMLAAAAEAARRRPDLGWRILAGHGVPEADFSALAAGLPAGTVERARPDYRTLLAGAALAVSQCGYNTAVDLLATGTPAVLVPFEAGRETEQRLRAERFAQRGLAQVVAEAGLDADALLQAVAQAPRAPLPPHGLALDGAGRTVALVEAMMGAGAGAPLPQALPPPSAGEGGPRVSEGRERGAAVQDVRGIDAVPVLEAGLPSPPLLRRVPSPAEGGGGAALRRLRAALNRHAETHPPTPVWWRDDDAVAATPALDRLLALAEACAAPILLAAIPAGLATSLGRRLDGVPGVRLAVHGLAHANHAPAGEKPAEFGPHRPLAALVADAREGLRRARENLPEAALLPVFVPPWNRLTPDLAAALPELGYVGLSAAAPRQAPQAIPGLVRADSHIDPVDWRGTRSLADPERLVDDLVARLGDGDPVGILTHHLAHDAALWAFLEALLPLLLRHPAVTVRDPRHLFARPAVDARAAPWSRRPARAS